MTTLPDNHRRVLSVTARMVEQTLGEIEELLRSKRSGMLTERIEPSYAEPERGRLLSAIAKMRDLNAEMFRALNLEPSHYTEEQIIVAKKTHLWTVLVDSKSKGMKGFGVLPPEQAYVVDSYIDKLLESLLEIR
jgi:hypothetical protein